MVERLSGIMSQPRMTITVGRGGQRRATLTSSEMYADRLGRGAGSRKRSIKDRLGGSSSNAGRQMDYKRQRQEGGWRPPLFEDDKDGDLLPTNVQNGKQDLRYKLNQKNIVKSRQPDIASVKDLREKLSGPAQFSQARVFEFRRNPSSSMNGPLGPTAVSAPSLVAPRINPIPKPRSLVEDQTVGSLLQSLGLSKYLITFQAEEVDMTALRHMSDDDLKELGIPMGPRKKIVMALTSKR